MDPQADNPVQEADEVKVWMRRIKSAQMVKEAWENYYRVKECYRYWTGNQRDDPWDGGDRKAQHNMIHPDVAEQMAAMYFNAPYGKVVASPTRSETPGETIIEKSRRLQDTGINLVLDPKVGFRENTFLAIKESNWAFGAVEVGYSADFADNPSSARPALMEKKQAKVTTPLADSPAAAQAGTPVEAMDMEIRTLRSKLLGETIYVKHIPSNQVLVSASDKAILGNNDWLGYWEEHPLEDVRRSTAYENTEDLKATGTLKARDDGGDVDRVRLYKIWDLRTMTKVVLSEGHEKFLKRERFERCTLKLLRMDVDPYHFYPVPPVYLKLASQDEYNDSAEYMRKMRIGTVPRYTYDEDAVEPDQAAKFQSRDMNVMIPRKGGTRAPIEPVTQPSTAGAAVQTLSLGEKEFNTASSSVGSPYNPATQTATRAALANAKVQASDDFDRKMVADFLSGVIEELIMTALENMNIARLVAMNVDLDSPMALEEAAAVAKTFQMIDAEKLRDASLGISWHIEIDPDNLSPISEAERGQKLLSAIGLITQNQAAVLFSQVPSLLKQVLYSAGIRIGSDVDAVQQALKLIVQMNMMASAAGASPPGMSPPGGSQPGPGSVPPPAPQGSNMPVTVPGMPMIPGVVGGNA